MSELLVCMYGSTSLPYVGIFACENEVCTYACMHVCMYVSFITEHRHFIYASRSKYVFVYTLFIYECMYVHTVCNMIKARVLAL